MKAMRAVMVALTVTLLAPAASADLADDARAALAKATDYLTSTVACHGGYLWSYTADLSERWGEGAATETQIWVQPPGTPAMGMAFLRAYDATGDARYLNAARAAADALIWGRLESGGWDYRIDFDPEGARRWYLRRHVGEISDADAARRRNYTVFDDNTTQSAVRLLMRVDKATGMKSRYHGEAIASLEMLLTAQFGNGAWSQAYPPPQGDYAGYYTFNDNALNDCIAVMIEAYQTYGDERYRASALKGGDFTMLSQLPEPQAGWAQQYDYDVEPAPARWFEPAAVCSATTISNIQTLLDVYLLSGDDKYLTPIPAAVKWLEGSPIGENLWARFYELGTDKPIYVNLDRQVVYEFVNIRPGYSWQGDYGFRSMRDRWQRIVTRGRDTYLAEQSRTPTPEETRRRAQSLEPRLRAIIAALDGQGRWLEDGRIEMDAYIANAGVLCQYVEGNR